jgi:hypothetical protein
MFDKIALGEVDVPSERLDRALIVAGARTPYELEHERRVFHRIADPILERVKDLPDILAAKAILEQLHAPGSDGLAALRVYQADAVSLVDVLETGGYNCNSATLLYVLVASAAGIDARAVQIDNVAPAMGHVQAIVVFGDAHVRIETTRPDGFDVEMITPVLDTVVRWTRYPGQDYRERIVKEIGFTDVLANVYSNAAHHTPDDAERGLSAYLAWRAVMLHSPSESTYWARIEPQSPSFYGRASDVGRGRGLQLQLLPIEAR